MDTTNKNTDVQEKVIRLLAEQLGMRTRDITADSTREVLGMDSLDDIEVLMAIEEEFDMDISDAEASRLDTVQKVVDYVTSRI